MYTLQELLTAEGLDAVKPRTRRAAPHRCPPGKLTQKPLLPCAIAHRHTKQQTTTRNTTNVDTRDRSLQ